MDEARFGWYAHPPPGATPGQDPRPHDRYDGDDRSISMDDFDQRGFDLSRELQRELGDLYTVQYHFAFAGDRSDLRRIAEQDVVPGWRVSRW